MLDAASRRNLELDFHPSGQLEYTLLGVLDKTMTAMGSRCLRRWLNRPLRDTQILRNRFESISWLLGDKLYKTVQTILRHIGDIERISSRIALKSARPRDLLVLRNTLSVLPELQTLFNQCEAPHLNRLMQDIGTHPQLLTLLQQAIIDNPPVLIRDGGVIAEGYHPELDELRNLSANADQYLLDMENRERTRPALIRLKSITTGYMAITSKYLIYTPTKFPSHYTRKQTLKGAERYITEELKAFEDKVLSAREKALAFEKCLYDELLSRNC